MKVWQKTVIGFLMFILVVLIGAVAVGAVFYNDAKKVADDAYEPIEREIPSLRTEALDYSNAEPFSVLLLGIDTDAVRGSQTEGRSDSIMVATVNPQKKQTTLVSIPRDTYTELVGNGTSDKLNHAYAYGGVSMAMASVENLLDIPIDHYALVNMDGMTDLIDEVGGIDIDNHLAFDYEGASFPLGNIHLNGWEAVKYSRMRYDDPEGDYGRQRRQRIVLEALFHDLASIDSISNYKGLLDVLGNNAKTDLSWDTLMTLLKKYTPALSSMETDQLQGTSFDGDGVYGEYMINYQGIEPDELLRVQTLLKDQLEN
ncbi:transcriptional regulator [Enterococcus sp. JM4C]|uniref:LCP family glycopolymer transferase n=1 Tax=Candidatus Enterococcus huntleyi TaxID=1857217 RepID=UPI00137AAA20|nr:LCP family protein [Enterococcus sp. JM4C]KAF1297260.1 transcriptional regulator [Enterococcus sp. JM4C]